MPGLSVAELVGTLRDGDPGVVAIVGERIVGVAPQRVGDRAWIQRVAIAAEWCNRGIETDLLAGPEDRLQSSGVPRFAALVADEDRSGAQRLFTLAGYRASSQVCCYEKEAAPEPVARLTFTR